MTDNRTTELLCKLLEERGVSCQTDYLHVVWRVGPKLYDAVDNMDGTLTVSCLTPEQAVAATLGEPIIKCRDCRYYHDGTSNGRRYAEPHCLAIGELAYGALFEVHENDFCSWAERREP